MNLGGQTSWTSIDEPSYSEEDNKADELLEGIVEEVIRDCMLDSHSLSTDTNVSMAPFQSIFTPENVLSSHQQSLAEANGRCKNDAERQLHCEPPPKKARTDGAATVPLWSPSSYNFPGNLERDTLETVTAESDVSKKASLIVQECLSDRQMVQRELIENKEILSMRQARVSRLEVECRLFQEHRRFGPAEKLLTEKIVRQEELFENRELLGMQQHRCQRLQSLLEHTEKRMLEHHTIMEREKLKQDALVAISANSLALQSNVLEKSVGEILKDIQERKESAIVSADISNTRALLGIQSKRKENATHQMIDQHLVLQIEMNRRAALERKTSMEQEIQYRMAMEHAMKRQQLMQKSMEERQFMMMQSNTQDRIQQSLEMAVTGISTSNKCDSTEDASHELTDSIQTSDNMKIGDDAVTLAEGKIDEISDDDSSIVI
eukprot:CAMPEP_0201118292 /NCGR_PEP_ID=MMETSP0850-20130426/2431_1 /ASSEMBLY_ACC=CAM_ASM_000622 /TAXON_ID=183588 /ORGANISM="Pseudo-nitzschia fraudulenta, Strain WWA7" /LENGTH=434 /DNA_ID=CAMNT_0047383377 /DNA_START=149 /DNA_END=1453 /DNA_ORIENTATION=-